MTDSGSGLYLALATIVAVFLGPVLAVCVARHMDDRRADKARKLNIFNTLMRTRGMKLDREHVGALNLVQVEFIDHPGVMEAWRLYLANLGEMLPPMEEKGRHDEIRQKRASLLTKLIYEIAKVLGVKIEQLDILEDNYVPKGWSDDEWGRAPCPAWSCQRAPRKSAYSQSNSTSRNRRNLSIHLHRIPSKRVV